MTDQKPNKSNARPTIGLLVHDVSDSLGGPFWAGAADAAREHGVNLICFTGGILRSPLGFDAQRNVLYDLISAEVVDGLVIWTGILSHYIDQKDLAVFFERYRGLPKVNIEVPVGGIPCVLLDYYQGMCDVIAHLIEVHKYRRIAFIRGPEGSRTGDERYQAYVDTLAKYEIDFDPNLVAPGTFFAPSGAEAIRLLLDERQVDFEAVAAANDNMAIDALQALQARGMRVPDDVAVVGFDDLDEAHVVSPPLTTARIPLYEWSRRGVELLLKRLQHEEVPREIVLPAQVSIRQSCGCLAAEVMQAIVEPGVASGESFEAAFDAHKERILPEMSRAVSSSLHLVDAYGNQLLETFAAGVRGDAPGGFLTVLSEILQRTEAAGEDVAAWNGVISTLRREMLPYPDDREAMSRAENLWHQARVMIGQEAQRAQAYQKLQADQQAEALREVGQILATCDSKEGLMDAIAQELPRLGIPSCAIAVYEDPEAPAQWSQLILACGADGRIELEPGKQRFLPQMLLPAEALLQARTDEPDRPYSYVVESLYFRGNSIGFMLLEEGTREKVVYGALRAAVSSALWEVELRQQIEKRALQLQTAAEVSRAASSSILDLQDLIQHVVDLIRDRFDLYYVGLFLVDKESRATGEPGKWVELQAGTGAAGRKMVKQRHRLKVGRQSMIGTCVDTGEARISLDVGEEAVRFENPLLPETRSELALPLISRGETIGALTIQSSEEAAFDEEDITVLQTVADQVANAIENTRLFKQTQDALEELESVHRSYIRRAWGDFIGKRST